MTDVSDGLPRVDVLGVPISPINLEIAVQAIETWIAEGSHHYVCIRDAHGIIRCQTDNELRVIHENAGMVTPDGMPVVWMCRALGYGQTSRVYGPDLMRLVTSVSAERGYRQFYFGGNEGVADLLASTLKSQHPKLNVVGTHTPPFRPLTSEEDEAVVKQINDSGADIVWIGLSTPKQEHWMASHLGRIKAPVMIGVGAAFDFLTGTKSQAPLWMQRSGTEWIFRLGTEPGRLGRRYAHTVPAFIYLAARQLAAERARKRQALTQQGKPGPPNARD